MAAIPSVGGISLPTPVATALSAASGATAATEPASAASFSTMLQNGLDALQRAQSTAEELGTQAATGQLSDPAQYMIASTQAQLTTELTVALRNKAVEAFNEIMRMQA